MEMPRYCFEREQLSGGTWQDPNPGKGSPLLTNLVPTGRDIHAGNPAAQSSISGNIERGLPVPNADGTRFLKYTGRIDGARRTCILIVYILSLGEQIEIRT
jgi:hypothetical protein